jgi:hypothetical protein
MGRKLVGMTLDEHLQHAKIVVEIKNNLLKLSSTCGSKFGWSHKTHKDAERVLRVLDNLRSSLDDEYHKIATAEDFHKHGHVYYKEKNHDN